MGKFVDITGEKYGRLQVLAKDDASKSKYAMWICKCECGSIVIKRGSSLRSGHTKSCGCLHDELSSKRISAQNETHNMSNTRPYKIWVDMKKRCSNKKHWAFGHYGGRGIKVCDEWQEFLPFYEWSMANGYADNLTIDRIDNDGDYRPSNCRWATRKEQANNKSNNTIYEVDGKKHTIRKLSDLYGISYGTLSSRIRSYGWSVEKAVSTPVRRCKRTWS